MTALIILGITLGFGNLNSQTESTDMSKENNEILKENNGLLVETTGLLKNKNKNLVEQENIVGLGLGGFSGFTFTYDRIIKNRFTAGGHFMRLTDNYTSIGFGGNYYFNKKGIRYNTLNPYVGAHLNYTNFAGSFGLNSTKLYLPVGVSLFRNSGFTVSMDYGLTFGESVRDDFFDFNSNKGVLDDLNARLRGNFKIGYTF